jgi:hypothetical protein
MIMAAQLARLRPMQAVGSSTLARTISSVVIARLDRAIR